MSRALLMLDSYKEKYSEYGEHLGDKFPEFLLNVVVSDLAKALDHNEYLNKRMNNNYATH
jgi:hypothetical protein